LIATNKAPPFIETLSEAEKEIFLEKSGAFINDGYSVYGKYNLVQQSGGIMRRY